MTFKTWFINEFFNLRKDDILSKFLPRFLVNYLNGINQFRVSLHIMTCFENAASCDQEILVLNNTILPKSVCNFSLGTPFKGGIWLVYFLQLFDEKLAFAFYSSVIFDKMKTALLFDFVGELDLLFSYHVLFFIR